MKNILDKIKAQRAVKGYSQEYMATKLDIDYSTYGKIENGYSKLTVDRLFLIMEILEININQMFDFAPQFTGVSNQKVQPKIIIEIPFSGEDITDLNAIIKNVINKK